MCNYYVSHNYFVGNAMATNCYQYLCPDCWTPKKAEHSVVSYSQLPTPGAHEDYVFPQDQADFSSHPKTSSLRDSYGISPHSQKPRGVETQRREVPEAFIQFSLEFNSKENLLKVNLQRAYNFDAKYPNGQYSISLYLYPDKQQEFASNIRSYSSSPVFNEVFEFSNWSKSNGQILIFSVYKHIKCIRRRVGMIPVDLNSVDFDGKTIQRKIQDNTKDIKAYQNLLSRSDACGCHPVKTNPSSKKAVTKLIIASVMSFLFMIGEVLGGYFAGSLAIMTDAAHMLSDLAGFLISLFSIWMGARPPSKRMSFGWHRAEVIGAIISVLIVWVLTSVLFYEAIQRVIDPNLIDVNPDIMLITACVGVFVNVFMCAVLGHGHGHSHGGGGHGHSHGGKKSKRHGHSHSPDLEEDNTRFGRFKRRLRRKTKQDNSENINVRAAFVHVIGDLIQSIGVVIAGYIIWIRPDWKLADPICTFLFCILVLFSTVNVLKDALRVLMEGTPSHIDYEDVKADLEEIHGVKQAHSLHIWSLTTTRTALSAHLTVEPGINTQDILDEANRMVKETHDIAHTTLQVEDFTDLMNDCNTCQQKQERSFCSVM